MGFRVPTRQPTQPQPTHPRTRASHSSPCRQDYRFRRHHCKHICLALSHLGILDKPHKWQQVRPLPVMRFSLLDPTSVLYTPSHCSSP